MNIEYGHLGNLGMSPITGQLPSPAVQAALLRDILEPVVSAIITIDHGGLIESWQPSGCAGTHWPKRQDAYAGGALPD
jgi:hypothetical protein